MVKDIETLNIGIVGHIDHGKTSILQKLSGKWTDTHSEEMKRGITIKLGYADIVISKDDKGKYNRNGEGEALRHVTFVDSPGHEMLMATMLSGAAIIDAAILVIAANEGIKPQTREHLMALQAKKIKNLIVLQNKIDLVTKDEALKNYADIKKLLGNRFDQIIVIPVSAQQNVNLDEVYNAIMEIPSPKRDDTGAPIFLIARSFDINKPGTTPKDLHGAVLGGTLKKGTLKIGDEIEIKPGIVIKEANQYHYKTVRCKVINLFNGSKAVSELKSGGSTSVETSLDMSIGKSDALSGCVASSVGTMKEITQTLKIKYELFPEITLGNEQKKIEPIKVSEMIMLNINTSMTIGIVKKLTPTEIELSLKVPIVSFARDNVGIARNIASHWRLIGHGEVT